MRFGLFLPNFGAGFCEAAGLAALAADAEAAGWDGLFLWDHVSPGPGLPVVDPWVAMTAIALATRRLRLGALVTPLARRRPWNVAREAASLDRLCGGRLVFGVGTGSGRAGEWGDLGEQTDLRVRGDMLDEALEVLCGLWSGEPFSFSGRHYRVSGQRFLPTPFQRPRIPIWVATYGTARRPLRRAARFDGVFPLFRGARPEQEPALLAALVAEVRELRPAGAPFEVVHCAGPRSRDELREGALRGSLASLADAGATWWLERLTPDGLGGDWNEGWPHEAVRAHVRAGPPR